MKIYIKNLDLKEANHKNIHLIQYHYQCKFYHELYSEFGIYRIENGKVLKRLNIIDGECIELNDYITNYNILLDTTIIKKEENNVMQIPNDHIVCKKIVNMYRLREKSPLIMIVEINSENNEVYDIYFQLNETYAAYSEADMNNEFIKNDLYSFIKLLS